MVSYLSALTEHHLLADTMGSSYAASGTLMLIAFVVVFVASQVNDNYSWVDRTWSILPVVYTWIQIYYKHQSTKATLIEQHFRRGLPVSASTLFGLVITVWGCRLTYNFVRRGGYVRGGEDYRWNHVHSWRIFAKHPLLWSIFNFFVISLFQTWLLWAITLPVMNLPAAPATVKDVVFALVMLAFIILEAIGDEQQQRFQAAKRRTPRAKPYCYGFCVTGVFGYSRHLNVFCEGSIWVTLAVAAHSCGTHPIQWWQYVGCIVLEVLTLFSTGAITEKLTAEKYPGYAVYQRITPMLFPAISSTTEEVLFALESKKLLRKGT